MTLAQADEVQRERPRLLGMAFRMLGSFADAEDAVQEAYLRWHKQGDDERKRIHSPAAWLTRVTSRICLDELGSARVRREQYVGEWLPEPVPRGRVSELFGEPRDVLLADPLGRVELDESVSTALLVVLESLSPAERVVFVLHDVFAVPFGEIADIVGRTPDACRQLATSARRHVRERRAGRVSTAVHDEVVQAFVAACRGGDLAALTAVLDPAVELRSDGGGFVSAARKPVRGALNVARFLLGIMEKQPDTVVAAELTGDGIALRFGPGSGDTVAGVLNLHVRQNESGAPHIADVWIAMNPEKLTLWQPSRPSAD
ncbi:RNA polymerase sigma factor SigJ [Agreia bicolorata]|nr:RNA polymerase sigma factor SigJ [Agreia bicolorata]